jgi:hypothetical protein
MRVACYCVLHYGRDYLPYAIQSVYDAVDRFFIVHTPHPSHGTRVDVPAIESEQELRDAALSYDPRGKIDWESTVRFWQEGQHRDYALSKCQEWGADLVLVLDADEVWPTASVFAALNIAHRQAKARNWLLNFTTPWRSFYWVCRDHLWPVRIIDLRQPGGTAYLPMEELGDVYHMGYAVTDKVMRYKWRCHGHIGELRPHWFEKKWAVWPPAPDCHPACAENTWMPEPFDPRLLPLVLWSHPFWGMEPIP